MKKIVFENQTPFYLFTISIVIILTLPILLQDGMFMDGEQYACVSKNLAFGKGSFWHPFLSESWVRQGSINFMEQPPLFFGLQSVFFRLLGTSIYTERIYSIFMLILNILLIHSLWKLILPCDFHKISWLPILFWIITPVCFWSVQNNIIELTLSVFCLVAAYFIMKGLLKDNFKILNIFFGGVFIFLAILTKGLQGLFPLIIIFSYYLFIKKKYLRKILSSSLLLMSIPVIIFSLLIIFNDNAKECLFFYFNKRLLQRIENDPNVENRYYILILLVQELLPMLILLLGIVYIGFKKQMHLLSEKYMLANFFIFIGLAGSVPLILTLVQKNFYFVAAIPFFAIGLALYCSDIILALTQKLAKKQKTIFLLTAICAIFLFSCLTFSLFKIGKTSRDEEMLNDVYILGNYLKNEKTIDTNTDVYYTWNFQFYLLRKFNLSLNPNSKKQKYFIANKNIKSYPDSNYYYVNLNTKKYFLYQKK